ncbi:MULTISPECIES: hypothetical protein [Methylobacter]
MALEVLHFIEFLRFKNQPSINQELDQKIQQGIDQVNNGLGITIDNYFDGLNQRIQQRLGTANEYQIKTMPHA